jgi:hypothetical protein
MQPPKPITSCPKLRVAETFFISSLDHLIAKTLFIASFHYLHIQCNILHHTFPLTVWLLHVGCHPAPLFIQSQLISNIVPAGHQTALLKVINPEDGNYRVCQTTGNFKHYTLYTEGQNVK